ncbi:polysaccharide export protein [Dokdonia sinensis]|uniref:Polysaccharide export protein n=1 Tax=Dokdonia sinensis TaxID=2479847 RepID=A0A3M0GHS0_9FLAO|nr:polysaccharide biosynthesis/export family protein [Dokdonia sinensis]RMB63828.1 polysaccharide export protein [Dokdonia sinensis]
MNFYKVIILLALILGVTSCASKKNVIYLQDIQKIDSISSSTAYTTRIAPNDLLAITVTAENMAAVQPFNLPVSTTRDVNDGAQISTVNQPYLVHNDGTIDFPKLGELKVAGLDRQEVTTLVTEKLKKYIKDPRVEVRIQNFKITVLGAVKNPGTFAIKDERVTILEALGLAGDMTIYGERSNVLVLREDEGVKKYGRLDVTKSDFLDSPYYYLRQNDVVMVEQNNAEVQKSISNPNTGIYFSVASLLLSVFVIFTR